jgi:hypothetical protein
VRLATAARPARTRPRRPRGGPSAVVFGAAYATIVAIAVIWSTKVSAEQPSAGLAAVTVMNAPGLLIGPPTPGAVADHTVLRWTSLSGFEARFPGRVSLLDLALGAVSGLEFHGRAAVERH